MVHRETRKPKENVFPAYAGIIGIIPLFARFPLRISSKSGWLVHRLVFELVNLMFPAHDGITGTVTVIFMMPIYISYMMGWLLEGIYSCWLTFVFPASRDDWSHIMTADGDNQCFPHTPGWMAKQTPVFELQTVFPAYAGMIGWAA